MTDGLKGALCPQPGGHRPGVILQAADVAPPAVAQAWRHGGVTELHEVAAEAPIQTSESGTMQATIQIDERRIGPRGPSACSSMALPSAACVRAGLQPLKGRAQDGGMQRRDRVVVVKRRGMLLGIASTGSFRAPARAACLPARALQQTLRLRDRQEAKQNPPREVSCLQFNPIAQSEAPGPTLQRVRRVVVFVDLVESVRLMREAEDAAIAGWRRFVHGCRDRVLPAHRGRMVKSLGDGLLLEFQNSAAAMACIRDLQALVESAADTSSATPPMHLRFGAHVGDIVVDEFDIFGSDVNLAARLTTLASPGEIVMSSSLRCELVPFIDGEAEDLGDCHLKHIDEPVRAFRLPAAGPRRGKLELPMRTVDKLRPLVIVLPFAFDEGRPALAPVAATLGDHMVTLMAATPIWSVVSRLSTATLAGRALDAMDVAAAVGAQFVVQVQLSASGSDGTVRCHVLDGRYGDVIGETSVPLKIDAFAFDPEAAVEHLCSHVCSVVMARATAFGHAAALPNVPSYALLLRAMRLLHSLDQREMADAKGLLDYLSERHPRAPEAHAWSAKWHFLRLAQVAGDDHVAGIRTARVRLANGLDADPSHAMSLALDGHLMSFVDGDVGRSEERLRQAVEAGPNEPMAWTFLSGVLAHTDRGAEAVDAIERAMHVAPLEPSSSDLDLFAADAYKVAGELKKALVHAERAVRANAVHLSAWVQLIVLQMLNEQADLARANARRYLALRPGASVDRFLDRHPARGTWLAERDAQALLDAGLPH